MSWVDTIKATLGFGVVEKGPRLTRVMRDPGIVKPLPLSLQLQRIGGGVTPAQVSEIMRMADTGYIYQLVDLGNDARQKDCHLHSVLHTREIAVRMLDWQVMPASTSAKDVKIATFIGAALKDCIGYSADCVSFDTLIGHLAGGDFPGFAVSETIFAKDSGKIVPIGFSNLAQRRFVYDLQEGRLRQWDAGGPSAPYPGIDLQEAYPGKFLQYQPRIVGDIGPREGLIRPLMWAALFRNWTMRDWLTLAELAWKPWRTGKYDKSTASTEDINNLIAILDQMTASGVAVYPTGAEVEVHWPQQSGGASKSNHQSLFDAMGAEMSKAALGQTETTVSSASSGYSQAKVHNEVRKDIRDACAKAIAACIRAYLIAPLVRMNYGPNAATPGFAFLTEDAVDLLGFSTTIKNLRSPDVRLKIPATWVRERVGIPEPKDDEELLGPDPDEAVDIPIDPKSGLPKDPEPDDAETDDTQEAA